MNIGIDARPLTYQMTGIGTYLKQLLDEMQKIDRVNHYYLISNGPISFNLKNPLWFKIEGKIKKKMLSTLWMQCKAPLLAYKLKLDLFWGPRHHLPPLLPKKIKKMLTIHDVVHLLYPKTMPLSHLIVERLLMRLSILKADYIIAVSSSTESNIKDAYGICSDKIRTIYSGTPVLTKRTSIKKYKSLPSKYFLFVGSLEPRKNFERVFAAFEFLQPESYGVHLVIVGGKGWKNRKFLKRLKTHPLKSFIHLTGYITSAYLSKIYSQALCLVFPSLYEGFGFPILEAMACGTPVITSNISSMPEVAGGAAILVDPYDVDALAEAMHGVLTDKGLRESLVKKGLERVKQFSWEKCAEETIKVYESAYI
ncbi:MAG: glycosyltransferase family 4 protein [Desulfobacterales bacterium]|nr:glycosyltransferase family 4 protein [Desulfobacterales bacterium]